MPYDKDEKYFRKPVFNENFKYTFGRNKNNNNKNSKIINAFISSKLDRDMRFHDIWCWWQRLTIHKCIAADIQRY